MISIVISSYREKFFSALSRNIQDTIGDVDYEIIKIENPGIMGICEAYNKGANMAKYHYLCFVHEDILFHTPNWGTKMIDHLSKVNVGAIGVAGGAYKSANPSSWSNIKAYNGLNIIQRFKDENRGFERFLVNYREDNRFQVVSLDGVFICTIKEVWQEHLFDELNFKGFHGYDIDFSLNVSQHYNVYVIYDILIEHFSEGNPDKEWMEAAIKISHKWKQILPFTCIELNEEQIKKLEQKSFNSFKKKLRKLGYKRIKFLFYLWKFGNRDWNFRNLYRNKIRHNLVK